MQSEQINELAKALAAAQAKIQGAAKSKTNPHFKSRYADLESVWDACREQLTSNGLCVTQSFDPSASGVRLRTVLMHASGQWIDSLIEIPMTKQDPQGYGSAATYARRYALAAIVGVAPEDDDGNAATGKASHTIDVESFAERINAAKDEATLKTEWEAVSKIVKDAGDAAAFGALKNRVSARLAEFKKAAA
jgi:hypothetical protein